MTTANRRGRPGRYAQYENLVASLIPGQKKRATYVQGLGVFSGEKTTTLFVKVRFQKASTFKGRTYQAGDSVEIKLGHLASWSWAEAEAERDRLQGLADKGLPLEEVKPVTFGEHADHWLELKAGQASQGIARGHIEKHLKPFFGTKPLSTIGVGDVDRWAARQRAMCAPATVQRQLNTLKAILNHALKVGLIEKSPTLGAEPIRGIAARQRVLSAEEREAILAAADRIEAEQDGRATYQGHEIKGWLTNFVVWALHSGMRRGESLGLTFSDVFVAEGGATYIRIRKSKTGAGRTIACSDEMIAILERLQQIPRDEGDERLFPISLSTAKRKLARLWRECGIDDVRLHDFRRTHATVLANGGVPLRTIGGRLGHANLNMLEKHYAVFTPDDDAAQRVQELFTRKAVA